MKRRLLVPLLPLLLSLALSGCALRAAASPDSGRTPSPTSSPTSSPTASCTPPAGGRCAADVAWPGAIHLSADGRTLHGVVGCGGTLRAVEAADTVTLTLHVGAMGPGTMSCAMVDVGVRLPGPLGSRTVVDGVSGHQVRVLHPSSS
jgi:hypothetical protein